MKLATAVGIGLGLLFLGIWAWEQEWPKYRRLESSGVAAEGLITAKDASRGLVHYSFDVEEKGYSAVGRDLEDWQEGDKVVVYYLPKNPDVSIVGDPHDFVRRQNNILALAALLGPGLLAYFIWKELR